MASKHYDDLPERARVAFRKVIQKLETDERERIIDWLRARAIRLHDELTRTPGSELLPTAHIIQRHTMIQTLEKAADDLEQDAKP